MEKRKYTKIQALEAEIVSMHEYCINARMRKDTQGDS